MTMMGVGPCMWLFVILSVNIQILCSGENLYSFMASNVTVNDRVKGSHEVVRYTADIYYLDPIGRMKPSSTSTDPPIQWLQILRYVVYTADQPTLHRLEIFLLSQTQNDKAKMSNATAISTTSKGKSVVLLACGGGQCGQESSQQWAVPRLWVNADLVAKGIFRFQQIDEANGLATIQFPAAGRRPATVLTVTFPAPFIPVRAVMDYGNLTRELLFSPQHVVPLSKFTIPKSCIDSKQLIIQTSGVEGKEWLANALSLCPVAPSSTPAVSIPAPSSIAAPLPIAKTVVVKSPAQPLAIKSTKKHGGGGEGAELAIGLGVGLGVGIPVVVTVLLIPTAVGLILFRRMRGSVSIIVPEPTART